MPLLHLFAQNLRIIENLEISLAEQATLFCGENGAGKTSILEAIDFLSRGRTFRSRRLSPLLRAGSESVLVSGQVVDGKQKTHLGIQKFIDRTQPMLRCNQQKAESISNHANYLPVVCIHPESHQLIQGAAQHRRNYLDWSAFHAMPEFLSDWRRFNKCLRQRNHALRRNAGNTRELEGWTQELGVLGEKVDFTRSRIFQELNSIFLTYNNKLLPEHDIKLAYSRGWPSKKSLQQALEQALKQENKTKTTHWGPHRMEIKISYNNQDAAAIVSRGQQKLIAASLILAQINHAQQTSPRKCVTLLDDICAELDHVHTQALFTELQALGTQVFISAIEPKQVDLHGWDKAKVFHVKQGACKPLART